MFRVLCTQRIPGWVAAAKRYDKAIFGEFIEWTCTTNIDDATTFAERSEAEAAARYLVTVNRCIGMVCEVVEIE